MALMAMGDGTGGDGTHGDGTDGDGTDGAPPLTCALPHHPRAEYFCPATLRHCLALSDAPAGRLCLLLESRMCSRTDSQIAA
jgi:hypothetical protein